MNTPSSSTVGASSIAASSRSLSRKRVSPCGCVVWARGSATSTPAALPAPPAMRFTGSPPLALLARRRSRLVDLLELALRPLDRVLGLGALARLREHVDD